MNLVLSMNLPHYSLSQAALSQYTAQWREGLYLFCPIAHATPPNSIKVFFRLYFASLFSWALSKLLYWWNQAKTLENSLASSRLIREFHVLFKGYSRMIRVEPKHLGSASHREEILQCFDTSLRILTESCVEHYTFCVSQVNWQTLSIWRVSTNSLVERWTIWCSILSSRLSSANIKEKLSIWWMTRFTGDSKQILDIQLIFGNVFATVRIQNKSIL